MKSKKRETSQDLDNHYIENLNPNVLNFAAFKKLQRSTSALNKLTGSTAVFLVGRIAAIRLAVAPKPRKNTAVLGCAAPSGPGARQSGAVAMGFVRAVRTIILTVAHPRTG